MADRMVRCPEGHFYDTNKHIACPWCTPPLDITPAESQMTRAMPALVMTPPPAATPAPVPLQVDTPVPPPLEMPVPLKPVAIPMVRPAGPPDAETRRYGQFSKGTDPVVGWLVCLDGPDRGRDFRLKMERNFIGRSPSMDILVNDERISRDRHASIIFDPKNRSFWLAPGESTGLVYLNGALVHTPTQLKADDLIELGATKLVLIPFCSEKYEWV